MADRRRLTPVLACVLLWLAGMLLARLPAIEKLELAAVDASFGLLRQWGLAEAPVSAHGAGVELVAFDEASIAASGKPFALAHDELADTLDALRLAGVRAVAVDLALPPREYTALQPGAALRLAAALGRLRAVAPLVLGHVPGMAQGEAGALYAAMAGPRGRGLMLVAADADGALRRLDSSLGEHAGGAASPLLAQRLVAELARPVADGMVDFARGAAFTYTPVHTLLALAAREPAALRARFGGKVVVVGAVLPDQDRQRIPVALAAWEPGTTVAGMVFQAQAIRSLLRGSMIATPRWVGDLLALLALALVWRLRRRLAFASAAAVLALMVLGAAKPLLLAQGIDLPLAPGACALAAGLAWLAASVLHEHRAERARIRAIFAGYVSPAILETILSGALAAELSPRRRQLAFLFADMRGFTAFCAAHQPEEVIAFLNRYYGAITVPLHAHGATIDKFSGDGIMAFFGAPQASANPARDALLAGLGMLAALDALNAALAAEGRAPVRIGIGIAFGDAVLGNVGSASRHDYTATGAAAALAAHVQQHCKKGPYALLVERGAFERAGQGVEGFDAFEAALEKHGRVQLLGWPAAGRRKFDTAPSSAGHPFPAPAAHHFTHQDFER